MPSETPISTTGTITEIMESDCYRASLPNGKIVFAHPGKELRRTLREPLRIGDRVRLELTPFDFSKARISGLVSGLERGARNSG